MRGMRRFSFGLGLFVLFGTIAVGQDLPPEQQKDSKASKGTGTGSTEDAPSPDDIINQMSGGQGDQAEGKVEADANPALLEGGEFEAGRDIFENIFNPNATQGVPIEGLPGMRIEEVNLQGVMSGAFGTVALFLGKDKQIYTARLNQKFYNGVLSDIQKDKVVFEQEVIDEFGKKRPPVIKEVPLYTQNKKGRGK